MMERSEDIKIDKYLGALLGAAVGDALGWPNEQNSKNISKSTPKDKEIFQKWVRRDGGRYWSHDEEILPGEYSDDTQLIIATARSLQYGENWNIHFTGIELPAWTTYERGGGGATKRAADAWRRGNNPWSIEKEKIVDVERYFNAGGNGVAMRILPHVFRNEEKFDEVMRQVVLNGIYTHGHPRALIGAMVYADALLYLGKNEKTLGYGELVDYLVSRKGKWGMFPKLRDAWLSNADIILKTNYMDLWDGVAEEVITLLKIAREGLDEGALDMGNSVLEKLGCFDKKVNGAGTVTAVAAIYLASKYASSPRLALYEAAYLKNADTDTLASMVGGLLGMLHGSEFLSVSWLDVQDYEYLNKLAFLKPVESEVAFEKKGALLDCANPEFKARLKQLKPGATITAQPFNLLTIKERKLNKVNAKGIIVNTLKLVSEEGQSIYIKTFGKESEENSALTQQTINQEIVKQQPTRNLYPQSNNVPDRNFYKPSLDSNKIRSLANILPENMPSDQCFFFISDIMVELERSATGKIDEGSLYFLKEKWIKFDINNRNIERVINVIRHY
jgi:ADP-ribosylglycohydrolase